VGDGSPAGIATLASHDEVGQAGEFLDHTLDLRPVPFLFVLEIQGAGLEQPALQEAAHFDSQADGDWRGRGHSAAVHLDVAQHEPRCSQHLRDHALDFDFVLRGVARQVHDLVGRHLQVAVRQYALDTHQLPGRHAGCQRPLQQHAIERALPRCHRDQPGTDQPGHRIGEHGQTRGDPVPAIRPRVQAPDHHGLAGPQNCCRTRTVVHRRGVGLNRHAGHHELAGLHLRHRTLGNRPHVQSAGDARGGVGAALPLHSGHHAQAQVQ